MKTTGKITTTLFLLTSLYVFGYWLLFKKAWIYHLMPYTIHSETMCFTYEALDTVFSPIKKLDRHLHLEIPIRNQLIGDWHSHSTSDRVSIRPNLQCQFRLSDFAFDGKVEYNSLIDGLSAKFEYQGQPYLFTINFESRDDEPESKDPFGSENAEIIAWATVKRGSGPSRPDEIVYETGLTKQAPSSPAP